MVNSDQLVRSVIAQIVSKHWPEKVDAKADFYDDNSGNQFWNESWRYPGWGCDTLDHMVDDLVSVIASMVVDNTKQSDGVL